LGETPGRQSGLKNTFSKPVVGLFAISFYCWLREPQPTIKRMALLSLSRDKNTYKKQHIKLCLIKSLRGGTTKQSIVFI